jgi:hypothetical protein
MISEVGRLQAEQERTATKGGIPLSCRSYFDRDGAEGLTRGAGHVREGDFNILDIEAFLELSRESVAKGAVVFLEAPGPEEEIQEGVVKAGKDDEGTRFIETLHILLCDVLQDAEDVPDVLMVANPDIEIEKEAIEEDSF